jgi:hypothetical protein
MAWFRRQNTVLAAFFLMAFGLLRRDFVHCSIVHRGWPVYASDYAFTRGFPVGWLIVDAGPCDVSLRWWQHFLLGRFLIFFSVALVILIIAATIIARKAR